MLFGLIFKHKLQNTLQVIQALSIYLKTQFIFKGANAKSAVN